MEDIPNQLTYPRRDAGDVEESSNYLLQVKLVDSTRNQKSLILTPMTLTKWTLKKIFCVLQKPQIHLRCLSKITIKPFEHLVLRTKRQWMLLVFNSHIPRSINKIYNSTTDIWLIDYPLIVS